MWLAVLSLGLGAFAYLHHAHGEGALWVISGLGFAMTSARAWQLKRFPRDTPRAESFGQAGGGWLRGIDKGFPRKDSVHALSMTAEGRSAFRKYRQGMSELLAIPDGTG
jgi:hypothetical protein